MKKIILSLFSILLAFNMLAQAPQSFKYQSVVRTTDGTAVIANQAVAFRMSILQGNPAGTPVYMETQSALTNQFGIATLNIGEGTPESGIFADIDWSTGLYWIKVEIDPTNGTNFETAGTSQLLSVPYAIYSNSSELADSLGSQLESVNDRLVDAQIGLVLWNKLGSESEVQNSEIGLNGTIVGGDYAFEPAKYGDGYVRKAIGSNYITFPQTILQNLKSRGAVELWINPKVTNPVAYSYGVFPLLGNTFGTNSHVYIAWGDGTSGNGIYGSVNFDGTGHQTSPYESQYVATIGIPFHVAICWDVDGIDGTSNTVRVYRDGVLINTSDATWDANDITHNYDGFTLGMGPDGGGYDKYIVDNIKVWNYAKTSFDDRNMADEAVSNDHLISNTIEDVTGSGMMTYSTVDANATGFGAALFIAPDGNYEEADADAIATMPCLALALETGTGNKKVLLQGYIRNDSWSFTIGAPVYVSPTSGELTQTIPTVTGQQVQVVGYATATNIVYFNPDLTLIELK